MRYPLIFVCLLFTVQTPDPVKWTFSSKKIGADTFEIHLRAKIDKGWYIYSQFNEGGPGPSSFRFDKNKLLKRVGDVKEIGKLQTKHEKLFDAQVREFFSSVDFVQTMQRKDTGATIATGIVKFIACNGKLCLPPKELPFSVTIK
jgi:hypothetical protein